jgi:hypothetical protein
VAAVVAVSGEQEENRQQLTKTERLTKNNKKEKII